MNFNITFEQELIADSVERALQSCADPSTAWNILVEQGLTGLVVPAHAGGAGLGMVELALVLRAIGRQAIPVPFLSQIILPAALLHTLPGERASRLLASLPSGAARMIVAGLDAATAALPRAEHKGSAWLLSGCLWVADAANAETILVVALPCSEDEPAIFELASGAVGLTLETRAQLDGSQQTGITMAGAPASRVAPGPAVDAIQTALCWGRAAISAEGAGLIETLAKRTTEHLKTRRQFGRPLAQFQALQHRLVDMHIQHELCWSMAAAAAMAVDGASDQTRERVTCAAKAQLCVSGRTVLEEAIQLHGATGMIDESSIAPFIKRLLVLEPWLGNRILQFDRLSAPPCNAGGGPGKGGSVDVARH